MVSNQDKELAERVIKLHDGKNFDELRKMSLPAPPDRSDGLITEETYIASCKEIQHELGVLSSLEFVESLKRENSLLTLWKAKYSSSHDEVLWAIGIELETHKLKDVVVNW